MSLASVRDRSARTITLSQPSYIKALAKKYAGRFTEHGMPYDASKAEREKLERLQPAKESEKMNVTEYPELYGALAWPTNQTRPDGAFILSFLGSFCQSPGKEHFRRLLGVLGYYVRTYELGITYGGKSSLPPGFDELPSDFDSTLRMHTYADSSWGKDVKPYAGYVVMVNGGASDWKAGKLGVVADSTAEAEASIVSKGAKATVAMRNVAAHVGRPASGPSALATDSQALCDIVSKPGTTSRTRYFERTTMLVKELYVRDIVYLVHVPTEKMIADIFTKAVDKDIFLRCRDYMLNVVNQPGLQHAFLAGALRRLSGL